MRALRVAACAAGLSLAASPALSDCCWSPPNVVYAEPPIAILTAPPGYLLDPSDVYPPVYVVNQGPVPGAPAIVPVPVPTYSEGGYAYPADFPYVRSYYGDRWFTAPPPRRYGRPAQGGYRPSNGARVIEVTQGIPPK
jgi:hypothetical protein